MSFARYLIAGLLLLTSGVGARQAGEPRSWSMDEKSVADIPLLALPAIDPPALLEEDERGSVAYKGGGVLRVALPIAVSATLASHGRWLELGDGGRLWQQRFAVDNATDLNFSLAKLDLPPGATLHIFSTRERYYQGPYARDDVRLHGKFWTPVLPGDEAVLELYLPRASSKAALAMAAVNAGYRDLFGREGSPLLKRGSCNIDVACPLGDAYRNEIRSVARYLINGNGLCTGTLMMDAAGSFRPWFLTAGHCNVSSEAVADSLVFYWNYEMPTCGAIGGSSWNQNQTGSAFRARRVDVDMSLVELDAAPDPAFKVFYSGWDRTGAAPTGSIHIHHPTGKEKSISFNDDPLTTGNSCIGTGGVNSHWDIDNYEQGTTEQGSSGSGVWTPAPNPRLIGFLSGGAASCSNLAAGDCYGKFSVAWDGTGAAVRLKDWLGSGQGSPPPTVNGSDPSGFMLQLSPAALSACRGQSSDVTVSVSATGGFSSPVTLSTGGLPAGVTASFDVNPVTPPGSATLQLDVSGAASTGPASVTVTGTSGADASGAPLGLDIDPAAPGGAPVLTAPAGAATDVALLPQFTWDAVAGATSYRLEVAAAGDFGSPVIDQTLPGTTYTAGTALQPDAGYSWRVTASNGCGPGPTSAADSFTTSDRICLASPAAIPDNNLTGVSQQIDLSGSAELTDLDVSVQVTHTYVGDLSVVLRHETTGTEVVLIDRPGVPASPNGCPGNDIDVTLDDEATGLVEDQCVTSGIAISGRFPPQNPLSAFDGESMDGTWTLRVSDAAIEDTGTLDQWCLLPVTQPGDGIFDDGFEGVIGR